MYYCKHKPKSKNRGGMRTRLVGRPASCVYICNYAPYLLSLETTFLKACSQAYILITLMPEMTSFMTRTRWSVTRADLNLR